MDSYVFADMDREAMSAGEIEDSIRDELDEQITPMPDTKAWLEYAEHQLGKPSVVKYREMDTPNELNTVLERLDKNAEANRHEFLSPAGRARKEKLDELAAFEFDALDKHLEREHRLVSRKGKRQRINLLEERLNCAFENLCSVQYGSQISKIASFGRQLRKLDPNNSYLSTWAMRFINGEIAPDTAEVIRDPKNCNTYMNPDKALGLIRQKLDSMSIFKDEKASYRVDEARYKQDGATMCRYEIYVQAKDGTGERLVARVSGSYNGNTKVKFFAFSASQIASKCNDDDQEDICLNGRYVNRKGTQTAMSGVQQHDVKVNGGSDVSGLTYVPTRPSPVATSNAYIATALAFAHAKK